MITDLATVKTYLGLTTETQDDDLLTRLLGAAEDWIADRTNQQLEPIMATRAYSEWSGRVCGAVLHLDADLVSVTTLTNGNGQVIPAEGYWLEPRNAPPYSAIRLKTSQVWQFDVDGEILVAGRWGLPSVPPRLIQACVRLTAFLYRQKDSTSDADRPLITADGTVVLPSALPKDIIAYIDSLRTWSL